MSDVFGDEVMVYLNSEVFWFFLMMVIEELLICWLCFKKMKELICFWEEWNECMVYCIESVIVKKILDRVLVVFGVVYVFVVKMYLEKVDWYWIFIYDEWEKGNINWMYDFIGWLVIWWGCISLRIDI